MSAALCTWDASPTQPVDGYNVYLRKGEGVLAVYGKANTSLINALQYKLTNLSPGTYTAYETAVKGQNESDPSNIATFIIEFDDFYIPSGLSEIVTGSDVDFSWDYVPGITQYNLYLKQGAGSFIKQNTSPIYSNEFSLTGLSVSTYEWYISAVYDGSEKDSSIAEFDIGT